MKLTTFNWTGNVENGSAGNNVYWRVRDGLAADPITSMLAEHVRKGLADVVHDLAVGEDNRVNIRFSDSFFINLRKNVLPATPLTFLSKEAQAHIVNVIKNSLFTEDAP